MAPMQEIPRISTVSLGLPSVAMDRSKELLSHTSLFAGRRWKPRSVCVLQRTDWIYETGGFVTLDFSSPKGSVGWSGVLGF